MGSDRKCDSIFSDGYLLLRPEYKTRSGIGSGKCTLRALQERAILKLHKDSLFQA